MPIRIHHKGRLFILLCLFFILSSISSRAQTLYLLGSDGILRYTRVNSDLTLNEVSPGVIFHTIDLSAYGFSMMTVDPINRLLYFSNGQYLYRTDHNGQNIQLLLDHGSMAGYDDISYCIAEEAIYAVGMGGVNGAYVYYPGDNDDYRLSMEGHGNEDYISVTVDNTNDKVFFSTYNRVVSTDLGGSTYHSVYQAGGPFQLNRKLNFNDVDNVLYMDAAEFSGARVIVYNIDNGNEEVRVVDLSHNIVSTVKKDIYYAAENDYDNEQVVISMERYNNFSGRTTQVVSGFYVTELDFMLDYYPPTILSTTPANQEEEVNYNLSTLTFTFNEPIKLNTAGNPTSVNSSIRIMRASDNTQVAQFFRNDAGISIAGNVVTVNGDLNLQPNTTYYVWVGSSVFLDDAGNSFLGISSSTIWRFSTEIEICSPAPVAVEANIPVCDVGTLVPLEVNEPPQGYTVKWYTTSDGNIEATGSVGATSSIFNITTTEVGEFHYWAAFENGTCVSDRAEIILIVDATFGIAPYPIEVTACEATQLDGGVVTMGSNVTYQWQVGSSITGPFSDILVNGQSSSYFSNATATSYYRRITKSAGGGCVAIQNPITRTFIQPPTILQQPVGVNTCDEFYTVIVDVESGTWNYSWMLEETPISSFPSIFSGALTNELRIQNTNQAWSYIRCEISMGECKRYTDDVVVVFSPVISLTTPQSSDLSICNGEIPTLDGGDLTGGAYEFHYVWQYASTINGSYTTINGIDAPTYTPSSISSTTYFRRTAYNGPCVYEGTPIEVTVTSAPIITTHPTNAIVCDDDPTSFNVVATGSNLSYEWYHVVGASETLLSGSAYTGTTTNTLWITDPSGLSGQSYLCKVSVNGQCEVVSQPAVLMQYASPALIPQQISLCESGSGTGTVTLNLTDFNPAILGTQSFPLQWYTNTNSIVSTPTSIATPNNTTYFARATDPQSNCTSETNLQVSVLEKPVITPVTTKFICHGESTDLTFTASQSNTHYTWTVLNANGVIGASNGQGTAINQTLLNTTTGFQAVVYEVTPRLNDCIGDSFQQIVEVDFALQEFSLIGDDVYCAGTAGAVLSLSGRQGSVRYDLHQGNSVIAQLTSNVQSLTFGPQESGTYTVNAYTPNNCRTLMPGSLEVREILPPSNGQLNMSSSETLCVDQEIVLDVTFSDHPTEYQWTLPNQVREVSKNGNSITLRALQSGVIHVSVIGSNLCGEGPEVSAQLNLLENPTVSIDAIPRVVVNEAIPFSFSSGSTLSTVQWFFSDGQEFSSVNPSVIFSQAGDAVVTLNATGIDGCIGKDEMSFTILSGEVGSFSIKNIVTSNGDGLNDFLVIEDIDRFPESEVIVFDRWGNIVFQRKGYQNDWDFKKGSSYLPAGNYVCVIRNDGKLFSRTVTLLKDF
jgi:gliding motility-associated-like protein